MNSNQNNEVLLALTRSAMWNEEEKFYSENYECEDCDDIPTKDLEYCDYTILRTVFDRILELEKENAGLKDQCLQVESHEADLVTELTELKKREEYQCEKIDELLKVRDESVAQIDMMVVVGKAEMDKLKTEIENLKTNEEVREIHIAELIGRGMKVAGEDAAALKQARSVYRHARRVQDEKDQTIAVLRKEEKRLTDEFDLQGAEIVKLDAQIRGLKRELENLKTNEEVRELYIAELKEENKKMKTIIDDHSMVWMQVTTHESAIAKLKDELDDKIGGMEGLEEELTDLKEQMEECYSEEVVDEKIEEALEVAREEYDDKIKAMREHIDAGWDHNEDYPFNM
jgi:chromosome segregation ATPase